ncbi:nitroreductase family deazaflavin-dependent oxidoreductase [Occultella glacieicola]|uniref:Nitroreductase family deazaflavin-dependent oxidoreductase n=1 Tax=Occultella glacieicola TaxID=2518684 RepID=A0ABY2E2H1_9MICO|nr:nitroreductase family deazaflavin-dependent oxidoreductase [Occultella glacieicola]TDE90872.1 nitroreductase family deazaflavin-dependent oxidoreductase [Occultella glacieicola]
MNRSALSTAASCRLLTTGRRSGRPHVVSVWFVLAGDTVFVLARGPGTDWVRNVRAEPVVEVRHRRTVLPGRARLVTDEAESRRAQTAWQAKYAGRLADLPAYSPEATVVAVDLDH